MYGDTPYGGYAAGSGYGSAGASADYGDPEMAGVFKKLRKAVRKVVRVAAPLAAVALPVAGPALGLSALATGAIGGGVKLASGMAAGRGGPKVSQVATVRSVGTAKRPGTKTTAARWRGPSTALTRHWNKNPGRTVPQAVRASNAAASAMVARAQTQSGQGTATTAPGGNVQPVSIDWGDLIGRGIDTIGDIFGGGGGGGGNNTGPAPSPTPTPTPNAGMGVGTGLAIAAGVGVLAVLLMKRGR